MVVFLGECTGKIGLRCLQKCLDQTRKPSDISAENYAQFMFENLANPRIKSHCHVTCDLVNVKRNITLQMHQYELLLTIASNCN